MRGLQHWGSVLMEIIEAAAFLVHSYAKWLQHVWKDVISCVDHHV